MLPKKQKRGYGINYTALSFGDGNFIHSNDAFSPPQPECCCNLDQQELMSSSASCSRDMYSDPSPRIVVNVQSRSRAEFGSCCDFQSLCFYSCEALLMLVISGLALLYIFFLAPSFSAKPDASRSQQNKDMTGPKSLTQSIMAMKPTESAFLTAPNLLISPPKSNISAGGGYWRQQLEHIASHLKNFALSDKSFQEEVSERKLGKIIGYAVDIKEEDGVFSLCLDFDLIPEGDKRQRKRKPRSRYRQAYEKKKELGQKIRRGSFDSIVKQVVKKKPKKRPQSVPSRKEELSEETTELIKELQSLDRDLDEIERLIENGASGSAKNLDGVPVLVLAVRNFFHEAIPALIGAGAEVNEQFGPKGQTAIHEAVLLGLPGKVTLQTLLTNGADPEIADKRGETPQTLAIRLGFAELGDILAAHIGHRLLSK